MKQPPFRIDTEKWPDFATEVNQRLAESDGEQFQSLYNGARSGYQSDILVGTTIANTNVSWNAATEPQKQIAVAFAARGLDRSTLQNALDANKGPADPRYLSYEQWGLVPGVAADPIIQFADVITESGVRVHGRRIPEGW